MLIFFFTFDHHGNFPHTANCSGYKNVIPLYLLLQIKERLLSPFLQVEILVLCVPRMCLWSFSPKTNADLSSAQINWPSRVTVLPNKSRAMNAAN